jgi:glycosyltransferase involved in cell wall biosynthesis
VSADRSNNADSRRLRVLLLVQGEVGERLSGPEIRGLEMARVLASEHDVTVVARGDLRVVEPPVRAVAWSRTRIARETYAADVVIGPTVPPYALSAAAAGRTVAVADMYDPVELELATLGDDPESRAHRSSVQAMRSLQLRFADVILCAGDAQRRYIEPDLAGMQDPPEIVVVPFGLGDPPPPPSGASPLRAHFDGIAPDDTVVLWWGSLWRWFDPGTAIRAVAQLVDRHPRLRLVMAIGKPRSADLEKLSVAREARALAESLGVLDRSVFFLEEWIQYERRHEYLQDADIGLTIHADTPEAPLAARARYLDYAWTGLPCVLAAGDEIADAFARGGFAALVPPGSADATATAIDSWLRDPEALARARAAGPEVATQWRWPAAVAPLLELFDRADSRAMLRFRRPAAVASGAFYYYGLRMRHKVAEASRPRGRSRG